MAPSLLDLLVELRKALSKCSRLPLPDTEPLQTQAGNLLDNSDDSAIIARLDQKQLRR